MLHLCSAGENLVRLAYGAQHFRPRSPETSRFLLQLYERYRQEGTPMPFTKEQFIREVNQKIAKDPEMIELVLKDLPIEKRLEGVSAEDLLRGLSPEAREEFRRRLQTGE